jgi:hypothetical protein
LQPDCQRAKKEKRKKKKKKEEKKEQTWNSKVKSQICPNISLY